MEFISELQKSVYKHGLTPRNLAHLEEVFRQHVGDNQELQLDQFKKIVQSKNVFFSERIFSLYDTDNSGSVSLEEFLSGINKFAQQSPEEKLKVIFDVYDVDGDGFLEKAELYSVVKECMQENGLTFTDDQIEDLASTLFEKADIDHSGSISFREFRIQLERYTGLIENLSISVEKWLLPPRQRPLMNRLKDCLPRKLTWQYLRNNYVSGAFLVVYIAINIIIFVTSSVQMVKTEITSENILSKLFHQPALSFDIFMGSETRREETPPKKRIFEVFARASGLCLDFNCMFIVLPVLRQSLAYLRERGFSTFLPIDQAVYFHKLIGWFILGFSALHIIMHICNMYLGNQYHVASLLISKGNGIGWIEGSIFITGWMMLAVLIVIVVCSLDYVRQKGMFKMFYYIHLLYLSFWILLLIHGPNFWKWLLGPALLFLLEMIFRFRTFLNKGGRACVVKGVILPSKVIQLVIKRPRYFDFQPGDYVFIKIPSIAKFEWHPFTISSAPEQCDTLSLHVRAVGVWTNLLWTYFDKQYQVCEDTSCDVYEQQYFPDMEEKRVSIARSPSTCDITSDIQGDPQKYYVNPRTSINNDVKQEKERHEEYCLINVNKNGNNDMFQNQKQEGTDTPHEGNNNDMLQNQKREGTDTPHEGNNMLQNQTQEGTDTSHECNNDMLQDQRKEGENTPREDNNNDIFLKGSGQPCVTPKNRYEQGIKLEMSGSASTYDSTRRTRIPHRKKRLLVATTKDGGFRKTLPTVVFPVAWERDDEEEKLGQLASSLWNETLDTKHVIQAKKPLKVVLDGPYGLSTRQIFWSQHAVLIATEIGVTPFASILQSIMLQYQQSKMKCPSCDHQWLNLNPRTNRLLRKVDFIWLNQEQRSFEWFISLLSDLEIQQAEIGGTDDNFLDIHIFITSALHMNDMKALGLQLALDLLHEKSKRCLITGLKTRTQPGQPDWDKVFRELSDQRKGKVTVFYCGLSNLDRILHKKCNEYNFLFKKEIF